MSGYNNNYSYRSNRPLKKRSGCKYHAPGTSRNDNKTPFITGWKYSRHDGGIIKFIASPYSKTKRTKSDNGKTWENWFVRITFPNGQEIKANGMYHVETKKLYMKDQNRIANPSANNGGYWGKHISKNYNNRF